MTDIRQIGQYIDAMTQLKQYGPSDRCPARHRLWRVILDLEDIMTEEDRWIAIQMTNDGCGIPQ